jgi:hypothetical protein
VPQAYQELETKLDAVHTFVNNAARTVSLVYRNNRQKQASYRKVMISAPSTSAGIRS